MIFGSDIWQSYLAIPIISERPSRGGGAERLGLAWGGVRRLLRGDGPGAGEARRLPGGLAGRLGAPGGTCIPSTWTKYRPWSKLKLKLSRLYNL